MAIRVCVVACGAAVAATILAAQPGTRQISGRPEQPIRELLQPGDTSLVIDSGPPPLRAFIPSFIPASELLAGYASLANTVAVARIESRVPKLTSDGGWIVTSVRAVV
jgi:hypothetical protein